MKTVIKELIENLENDIKGCENALIDNIEKEFVKGIKRALEDVKIDLENALIKEKEQIIEAHFEGWSDAYEYLKDENLAPRQAEDYYNEYYNQNE